MRLRQVHMFTARVRVGQRRFTALCGKAVCTPTHCTSSNHRAAKVQNKQTGNFTCSLALVCACTDSCLAILQHWIQSTLYTHGIRPLLPGLHPSDRTPNSEQAKDRLEAIASQQHSTLVAVHLSKNSPVSSDPCFQKPFHTSAPYQQLSNSATVSTISLQSRTT